MCFVSLLSKGLLTEFSTTSVKHSVRGDGVHSYSHNQGSDLHGWPLEHLPLGSERGLSSAQTPLPMVWA